MPWEHKEGGVTAAGGFLAGAAAAGIKKEGSDRLDVALLFSVRESDVAAVYTRNRVKAAPLLWNMEKLAGGKARAVVINSGNANACTGQQGMLDATRTAELAGRLLGIEPAQVALASTGVIGVSLPMARLEKGLHCAAESLSPDGGRLAAQAILTTDTRPKEVAVRISMEGSSGSLGGMAKGSGMIHPDLATMLCFLTTDLAVEASFLQQSLLRAVEDSFNLLTVDGDTSTNDLVLLLANGLAGNKPLTEGSVEGEHFFQALLHVCQGLARQIAADGEGASKLVEVHVRGAASAADARLAARAVASSNLVKTALAGADANWGRILCAVGNSGANFDPEKVAIWFAGAAGREQVASGGAGLPFNEEQARAILEGKEITIEIDLEEGEGTALAYTCDLTCDYIRINADYRT